MVHTLIVDLLLMLDDASDSGPLKPADPEADFRDWLKRAESALRRQLKATAQSRYPAIYGNARRVGHDVPANYDLTGGSLSDAELNHHFPELAPALRAAAQGETKSWARILDPKNAEEQPFFERILHDTEKQFSR